MVLEAGLSLLGVLVILGAVLLIKPLRQQLAVVVGGILLVEAGVWKLAHLVLPEQRQYHALRAEGDWFMGLVRQLNAAALAVKADDSPANRQEFDDIQAAMRQTIDRMAAVAGKTDAELTREPQRTV